MSPDLSVYGKALAAGFPLSAVGGKRELFDVLRDGRTFHAGTYNGNPICLAAASAALEVLADPAVFTQMHAHGHALQQAIRTAAEAAGVTLAICGVGSVFSVHWGMSQAPQNYRQTLEADQQAYTRFRMRMLDRGVYLLPDARWYVGVVHDDSALQSAVDAIDQCLRAE
jgi:glutamate-1-semialdehyde 2,1-aminomutase